MSMTPFEQSTRQLHPADILRPCINKIKEGGLNVIEHNHGDEFHIFKFLRSPAYETYGVLEIFSKSDGLVQFVYTDFKSPESVYSSDIYPANNSDYFGFDHQFKMCMRSLLGHDDFAPIIQDSSPSIGTQLTTQNYDPHYDFDNTPSQIYSNWQQSRNNRDGMALDGKIIPHLT